jgi:flagellar biosynthesis/type III secretory pathway protein FliH
VRYENTLLHEKFREGAEEGLKEGRAEGRVEGLAEGEKKGLAEGEKKGLAKGREEKETEFILNAYQNGISIKQIAKIVQLSVENVTNILKQNEINT